MDTCVFASQCATHRAVLVVRVRLQRPVVGLMEAQKRSRGRADVLRIVNYVRKMQFEVFRGLERVVAEDSNPKNFFISNNKVSTE